MDLVSNLLAVLGAPVEHFGSTFNLGIKLSLLCSLYSPAFLDAVDLILHGSHNTLQLITQAPVHLGQPHQILFTRKPLQLVRHLLRHLGLLCMLIGRLLDDLQGLFLFMGSTFRGCLMVLLLLLDRVEIGDGLRRLHYGSIV